MKPLYPKSNALQTKTTVLYKYADGAHVVGSLPLSFYLRGYMVWKLLVEEFKMAVKCWAIFDMLMG